MIQKSKDSKLLESVKAFCTIYQDIDYYLKFFNKINDDEVHPEVKEILRKLRKYEKNLKKDLLKIKRERGEQFFIKYWYLMPVKDGSRPVGRPKKC